MPEGTRLYLLAPIVRGRKGEYRKELDAFHRQGYLRARVDGKWCAFSSLVGGSGGDKTSTSGGATGWLTSSAPVNAGEQFTLDLIIWDTGDGVLVPVGSGRSARGSCRTSSQSIRAED